MIDADNFIYTQDEDGNKYFLYNNDGTLEIRTVTYYYISYTDGNTTYYLNENNGAITRGTTPTTKWFRSGNNTGTLYTNSANGNTYYLYSVNNTNGSLSLSTTDSTTWTFNNNGRISYSYNGGWNNCESMISGIWAATDAMTLEDWDA